MPNGDINPNIHLISYENLPNSLNTFCKKINIESIDLAWHEKELSMRNCNNNFFNLWTNKEIEIVNEYFNSDFNIFGFAKLNLNQLQELKSSQILMPKKLIF